MTGEPTMTDQRNLIPAWWALCGFAAIPNAALDPPRRASCGPRASWGRVHSTISITQCRGKSQKSASALKAKGAALEIR